jgi:hypothetical protein
LIRKIDAQSSQVKPLGMYLVEAELITPDVFCLSPTKSKSNQNGMILSSDRPIELFLSIFRILLELSQMN